MNMLCGIHHFAILCSEKKRSMRFYETLGFRMTAHHQRKERGDEIIMMDGCGVTLELFIDPRHPARVSNPEAFGLRHLALQVEKNHLEDAVTKLVAAGYAPEPIRHDTFTEEAMTFVKDPDGLPIELHE